MPRSGPFDHFRDAYEAWFEENPLAYASELLAVRKVLPPGGRVLEVGVGSGRFSAPMKVPFGLDPSLPMLLLARKRGFRVLAGAGEALPVRDGALDALLMVTTLCYLDDPGRALAQARRALRPNGSLVCAFIDADSPLGRCYRERQAKSAFYRNARFWAAGEVLALLERTGFTVRDTIQTLTVLSERLREPETPRNGTGKGAFVVVRAVKEEIKGERTIN